MDRRIEDQEILRAHFSHAYDQLSDAFYVLDEKRRIVYWNPAAEQITGFSAAEVVGRSCADNILMHLDECGETLCKRACPAAAALEDGTSRQASIFVHSRSGELIPVRTTVSPYRDALGRVRYIVQSFACDQERQEMADELGQLREVAYRDPLTGLPNRRYIADHIAHCLHSMARYGQPFGLLVFDADAFKAINDTHGHDAGDDVLVRIANRLQQDARRVDMVGRWGGEEFMAVVRVEALEVLQRIAERMRHAVETDPNPARNGHGVIRVTVSCGATLARSDDTVVTIFQRADGAMYRAKASGRNRVCYQETPQ